ncbi:MAG: hypothetical protein CGU29_10860 [Candidatus Dactylopiibacterium carminicum]|uniref:DUF4124 domain-containing protein n=1 Tax=Candidatus Dactylopiibacterium carminicum TaxID=857335 RepID=A0A272ER98_9RHOO|nr:DUF4124 domain-containing protein [Candidatus Dactylopiibacterium carminicum]PAS92649.1 MAG: hypothetical protein CGU29_10860 [Candidatus Dactylopiibacterium carminicum]PAS98757.1 MAG: hypothetical protein BSR46_11790 [Candidatus Dactylopiibacterium carminicum]
MQDRESKVDRLIRRAGSLLLSLVAVSAQAEIYKWIDTEGRTHYSNVPPQNVKTQPVRNDGVTVLPAMVKPATNAVSAPAVVPGEVAVRDAPVAASAPSTASAPVSRDGPVAGASAATQAVPKRGRPPEDRQ